MNEPAHDGAEEPLPEPPPPTTRMPDGTQVDVVPTIPHRTPVRFLVPLAGVRGDETTILPPGTAGVCCGLWPQPIPGDAEDKRRGFWHLIAVDAPDGHGPWHVPVLPDQIEVR